MSEFTIYTVLDRILDEKVLINEKGEHRFDRKMKLQAVFPEEVCKYVLDRSYSYLTWFFNNDPRGDSVRAHVGKLLDQDPLGFVMDMVEKCGRFLDRNDGNALDIAVWDDLLTALGESNPLFMRGSQGYYSMNHMSRVLPQRVLTVLLLDAATGGLTSERFEKIFSCWHIIDKEIATGESTEPQRIIQAGEILYIDGQRKAAMQQFLKAAEMLDKSVAIGKRSGAPEETSAAEIGREELYAGLLLRMGEMYRNGDGCTADETEAEICFLKSASLGCAEACSPLAMLRLKNGYVEKARESLEAGASMGDLACLRQLGNSFFNGDVIASGKKDISRAGEYYLRGANPENISDGDARCQYMLGMILEMRQRVESCQSLQGPEADPEYWYEAAARKGSNDASARLNRLRWYAFGGGESGKKGEKPAEPAGTERTMRKKYCLLNSFSGHNRVLADSLPKGEYTVLACMGSGDSGELKVFPEHNSGEQKVFPEHNPGENTFSNNPREGSMEIRGETMSEMLQIIAEHFIAQSEKTAEIPGAEGAETAETAGREETLWETFPEILIMALGGEEQKNVQDGLQVLRTAFFLHEKIGRLITGAGRTDAGEETAEKEADCWKDKMFYLLSDRLRLYVQCREAADGPVFDSANSRLGDFYLPLYLCDQQKMTSINLVDRMPLFIPCLQNRAGESTRKTRSGGRKDSTVMWKGARMDTVIFGDHPGILQMCKDAIAAAQIDDIPFTLTVVSENAEELEDRFLSECPAIKNLPPGVTAEKPLFVKMKPESAAFQDYLSVSPPRKRLPEEEGIATRLQSAGYLIVYCTDEDRNLTMSMYLREWYLKTDPSFARLPFIAAYCEKMVRAEQLRTLTVGTEEVGFNWYNNYHIQCFGVEDRLFSYEDLVQSSLEKTALASHFSYYTTGSRFAVETDRFRAEHDYFTRCYNRDSSIVNAAAIIYRMFSAGIVFPEWHSYASGISRERLGRRFEEWICPGVGDEDVKREESRAASSEKGNAEISPGVGDEDAKRVESRAAGSEKGNPEKNTAAGAAEISEKNSVNGETKISRDMAAGKEAETEKEIKAARLEVLAMQEHGRWNRAMITRGWMPASTAQMQAYIQRGAGRHHLYLARLHPFITGWDNIGELEPGPTGLQKIYGFIMQQIRPGKSVSNIREIDRENVRKTARLLM